MPQRDSLVLMCYLLQLAVQFVRTVHTSVTLLDARKGKRMKSHISAASESKCPELAACFGGACSCSCCLRAKQMQAQIFGVCRER